MPYFSTEQLTGLIEDDLDLDGMVHFTGGRAQRECVCVCAGGRCLCGGGTNETMFSQQNGRERMNWTCIGL